MNNRNSDFFHSEFVTTFYVPDEFSQNEMETYISENQNSINGILKYFINDNEIIEIEIVNGNKVTSNNYNYASFFSFLQDEDDPYPKKDECSYDGIQDCVQYAVYEEWSTYTAIKCAITGGLECIADEAASCVEENCF
jgi:hypothetical protein